MGPKYRRMATLLRILMPFLIAPALGACHQSAPEPVTLNYLRLGWIPSGELPATEALSRKFTRETGVGLRHLRGAQEETLDQLTLTRKLLHEGGSGPRSEEHTSELQSHLNLVCRLLLEKKKKHE